MNRVVPGQRRHAAGLAAAVAAYVAWGFLAPGGKILLDSAGPWTLNFHRTWASLVVFVVIFGPRRSRAAAIALAADRGIWVLGVLMAATFVPYLASVGRLEATIATVLLYLAPLLIAWGAHRFLREQLSPLIWATVTLSLVGVVLAVSGPDGRLVASRSDPLGLGLGLISVVFWSLYTLWLAAISSRHDAATTTMGAFAVSGLVFLVGAAAFEGLAFSVTPVTLGWMAVYVAVPSVASFLLYSYAVERIGAATAGALLGIELLSTALVSRWLLAETFDVSKLTGMAIVLVAVTVFLIWGAPAPHDAAHDEP